MLSKRVEKAKKLSFSHNHYEPGRYSTWGSKDQNFGQKYYRVTLSHAIETITIINPDQKKKINMPVFLVDCKKDNGKGICDCPGNSHHTVCYHGLGAIYRSFEAKNKLVAFFESYETAKQMAFGGKLAKVKSLAGGGHLWCVIRDWPKKETLTVQDNINLMRGSEEDDEGID